MSDESLGPFRRDGRMRFATETRCDKAALRALVSGASLQFPGFAVALSLGPMVLALSSSAPWPLVISVLLLLFAWKSHQSFKLARRNAADEGARRVWITEDGVFLDGILGPAKWGWTAVESVRVKGTHVVLQLAAGEVMAMPVSGEEGERLAAFVRERTTPRLTDTPGQLLFLLSILYAALVVTTALVG